MGVHYIHGFRVESELLSGHDRAAGVSLDEVRVLFGGIRDVPGQVADGAILQSVAARGAGMLSSTVRYADGSILIRVHGHAEFEISPDLRDVVAWRDPDSSAGMLRIFTGGSLMGTQIILRGDLVLHASAVEIGGRTVAFVGDSGSGKSTMAALSCTRGGRFVTDDVLRVDIDGPPRCWLGSTENRLRFDLGQLTGAHSAIETSGSVDGRTVWTPDSSERELSFLHAVVLPVPTRKITRPILDRLQPAEAIVELTRRPRIPGWQASAGRSAAFANLARLAAQVPVYRAHVPWGPPFSPDAVDTLLRLLGFDALASLRA